MPLVAFSAALSLPRSEPGTVPFDRVLLNDGGYYDPETGKPGSRLAGQWGRPERLCGDMFSFLLPQTRGNLLMLWFGEIPTSFIYPFSPQLG